MQSLANELFDGNGQNLTLGIRNCLLETGGLAITAKTELEFSPLRAL
jgi:hypothetical protein